MLPRQVAPSMRLNIEQLLHRAGLPLTDFMETLAFPTTLGLVASGMGIAIVPASVLSVRMPGLVYRPIAQTGATSQVSLLTQASNVDPLTQEFIEVARSSTKPASPGSIAEKQLLVIEVDAQLLHPFKYEEKLVDARLACNELDEELKACFEAAKPAEPQTPEIVDGEDPALARHRKLQAASFPAGPGITHLPATAPTTQGRPRADHHRLWNTDIGKQPLRGPALGAHFL